MNRNNVSLTSMGHFKSLEFLRVKKKHVQNKESTAIYIIHLFALNYKSKDYCKADSEQRVLFFKHNNISAGHTSLLQVYICY